MITGGTPVSFVSVADRERAIAFYRDVLGLTLRSEDGFGLFFDMGGTLLRMTPFPNFEPSLHSVLGWNVDDIHAAVAALKAKGVEFNIYDGFDQDADGVWTAPDNGAKVAWFKDSEGNVLSLSQA